MTAGLTLASAKLKYEAENEIALLNSVVLLLENVKYSHWQESKSDGRLDDVICLSVVGLVSFLSHDTPDYPVT